MKKTIIILFLLSSLSIKAQLTINCNLTEQEHYPDGIYATTELPTQSKTIVTDTATMKITFNPNLKLYICGRCKTFIEEPIQERPDTVFIWRKKE